MRSSVRASATSRANVRLGSARPSVVKQSSLYSSRSERAGATSPAESTMSSTTAGTKRKERDFDSDAGGAETNINVVVRCRGRNAREVKENSAVVVNTDGVKGQAVELFMGASALSNKTYNFDGVFSPAADQSMIFDDTVKPILEEMLAGYNCTIFAYGQTGTGKTYTMSGDMTNTLGMLSDEAGIIPRVLEQLFNKLEIEDAENCVKCSFIELYNEELRDLLSVDESAKLKIYDDTSRRGHATTIVQGMEEKHIKNATEGIKVLQEGSLKRQVAATKCNDLSSRSHTVFTITAYVKKTNDQGVDDFVSAGKLNLVDLAGSENIQRSGAENKRAAEAGLINKSLLTLGRVINALVDKSSHIPYRESKLTRLLQDSLGGRTKTCIIATISPAKSNMEETISTLEYAFRAKNIKNKPQLNTMLNKKTLLKDFTSEIEKLKSELISTRQRNGVYLSNELYEEMTAQNESRRIVVNEQNAKIETLETNLRNKVHELFSLTTSFMGAKKDHEGTKAQLDETKGVLDQTEIVLSVTRKTLAEETQLRKAHAETEEQLSKIGGQLIGKLRGTIKDVGGLHAKNKRKSDLQSLNRMAWGTTQAQVTDVTSMIERRLGEFREEQEEQITSVSQRMEAFVGEELQKLSSTQLSLEEHLTSFGEVKKHLLESKQVSKDEMDSVLDEIKVVRDTVKGRVGESLQVISHAAEKIAADVVNEMNGFHTQLHNSYSVLGKDFKSIFEDLVKHITAQRSESDLLRRQLQSATNAIILQNVSMSTRMQDLLDEERRQAAEDRQKLLSQVTNLVNANSEAQDTRLAEKTVQLQKSISDSNGSLEGALSCYGSGMDTWDEKEGQLMEEVKKSRDQIKLKLKDDWNAANDFSTSIQNTAKLVHAETTRAVEEQVEDLGVQMEALDEFVAHAKSENAKQHATQSHSIQSLSNTVELSFGNISSQFKTTFDRVKNLGEEMELDTNDLRDALEPLDSQIGQPLANLREAIGISKLQEYQSTGETPQRVQYQFPTQLPRTAAHELMPSVGDGAGSATPSRPERRSDKVLDNDSTMIFADLSTPTANMPLLDESQDVIVAVPAAKDKIPPLMSLREIDLNLTANTNFTTSAINFDPNPSNIIIPADLTLPLSKRSTRIARGKKPGLGEGRENQPLTASAFLQTASKRKSPRLN